MSYSTSGTGRAHLFNRISQQYNEGGYASHGHRLVIIAGCIAATVTYKFAHQQPISCESAYYDPFNSGNPAVLNRLRIIQLEALKTGVGRKTDGKIIAATKTTGSSGPVSLWPALWRLLKPEAWLLLAVVATAMASATINLRAPVVIGELINIISRSLRATAGITQASIIQSLHQSALKLLTLFAAQGVFTTAHIYFVSVLGENLSLRLHRELFTSLLSQDMAFFDRYRSGELVDRLSTDIVDFKHTFKQLVTQGLKATTLTVGSIAHLFYISPALTSVMAATMPLLYVGLYGYGRFLRQVRQTGRTWEGIASGIGMESLTNIRTVRAFTAETTETQLYLDACRQVGAANVRFGSHMGVFRGLTNFSIGSMVLIVLYYGGYLVAQDQLKAGQLMTYMISIQNAQRALDTLGGLMGQSIKAMGAFGRIQEYINVVPCIPIEGGYALNDLQGDIDFRNVDFIYPTRPDQPIFENFSLHVPAGQVVALCGSSGSGKSTVAALLERFYDPDAGMVTIDRHPLTQLDPTWLRGQIGYINQEPTLFATSIAENIRYGNPRATMEEIRQAAAEANAAEFIEGFPEGYNTVLGERGITLSGGQRQRIAIARAILKKPRILILDEATSALDNQSEKLVQAALDKLMHGRTVVVIAHRLSTIRNADCIVVMGNTPGHILEIGTHDELMARKGHYHNLFTRSQ
ncbi:hypothetical protein H4R33_002417 [Dimargaris cristalligena]|nr:hypothetical protein H4R33_002417 [Dimargaris cristalligena]